MKLMYQVPGYVSNSVFCFIYLFVYLFIYLFIYLLIRFVYFPVYLFIYLSIYSVYSVYLFCSFAYIDFIFVHLYCLISFHFHFRFKSLATKPHQTTPTYVLNFPSFLRVCVCMKRRRQGKNKTLSSRPELLQKSGNVLVLCMQQQQRLTVRRTGRGGMISCGLRTPRSIPTVPYIVGFALGRAWSASRPTSNEDSMWTSTCTLTLHVLRDGPFCSGKKACCHT